MNQSFERVATRVSGVSIVGNIVLSLFKLFAGIFSCSGALISDAVHSASDVLSSVIVIVGIKLASKGADAEHPYGHERIEPVAAIVLAMILCITGLFIGQSAFESITSGKADELPTPGKLALVAAIVSIVSKELMYWYTRRYALLLDSSAMMADAWHHRSDALSSVGALVGVMGARLGFSWFDPAASLIVCFFIFKAAYEIFVDAIEKMVDHAVGKETQQAIEQEALRQEGVVGIAGIQTREFGNKIYVDLEILADKNATLQQGDAVAQKVHDSIEQKFPKIKHIVVLVKPDLRG